MSHGLTERTWPSIILSPISVNGHIVTVSSTCGLKVKMTVTLSKVGVTEESFEIKRIFDSTTLMVGPLRANIKKTSEAVKFNGGTLSADEQSRNVLGDAPIIRAVYDEEPTIAIRTVLVDKLGQYYSNSNPLPVSSDGTPTLVNTVRIPYPVANVEQSVLLPAGTSRIYLAAEKLDAKLRVSYVSGGTTDIGNSYITVHQGNSYDREELEMPGNVLYYCANKSGITIEIEIWV